MSNPRKQKEKWYAKEIRNRSALKHAFGNTNVPGCDTIEAIWNKAPHPIGTVWYSWRGKAAVEVMSSYVISHYRRMGVRTYLHEKLIAAYPQLKAIITAGSTKDSKPWLKKMGFKQNDVDGWRLDIVREEKKR